MKSVKIILVLAAIVMLLASSFSFSAAQDKPFDGITIDILTFVGPQVAEPLQRRGPDFEALTGAKVNIVTVPNADLYQTMLTDLATGANTYDGFLFAPAWTVDFVPSGYLENLDEHIANDPDLEWEDVALFFRNFNSYDGSVYSIPLDGDFHMVYYNKSVLETLGMEPPKTWDDYLAIAEAANGMDFNGDGEGDYGSCISKARSQQSYWWITSIAAPFIQSQGTSQGVFFNTDTMEPLTNNAGFIRALEIYKATSEFGPPDEQTMNVGDTRTLFITGRCALSLDWGDIGTLAIDPEQSTMADNVGSIITPGSTEVVDWSTGELVACDETTCPYAVDGVNYAPFASFGGWSGAVNAAQDDDTKAATYAFFSYMNQPAQSNVDVTIGRTGYNPYRISQFENTELWVEAGMSQAAAEDYLGAINASLSSPNMVLDLRIPQNQRYQQVILDTVASQFLADEYTAEEAGQAIAEQWNEVTDELGREDQLAIYIATLGLEK